MNSLYFVLGAEKKDPLKEFPLNSVKVCALCEHDHPTQLFPSLWRLKAVLRAQQKRQNMIISCLLKSSGNSDHQVWIKNILCHLIPRIKCLIINDLCNNSSTLWHHGRTLTLLLPKFHIPYHGHLWQHRIPSWPYGHKDGEWPLSLEDKFLCQCHRNSYNSHETFHLITPIYGQKFLYNLILTQTINWWNKLNCHFFLHITSLPLLQGNLTSMEVYKP